MEYLDSEIALFQAQDEVRRLRAQRGEPPMNGLHHSAIYGRERLLGDTAWLGAVMLPLNVETPPPDQ